MDFYCQIYPSLPFPNDERASIIAYTIYVYCGNDWKKIAHNSSAAFYIRTSVSHIFQTYTFANFIPLCHSYIHSHFGSLYINSDFCPYSQWRKILDRERCINKDNSSAYSIYTTHTLTLKIFHAKTLEQNSLFRLLFAVYNCIRSRSHNSEPRHVCRNGTDIQPQSS